MSSSASIVGPPDLPKKRKPFNLHAFLTRVESAVLRVSVTVVFVVWIVRHLIHELWP